MKKRIDEGTFRRKACGFTLLEVMVSVVIISALAVGVTGAILYAKRASSSMQGKMLAVQLIEKKLVELKKTSGGAVGIFYEDKSEDLHNAVMKTEVVLPHAGITDFKKVVVALRWDDPWETKIENLAANPTTFADRKRQESITTFMYEGV